MTVTGLFFGKDALSGASRAIHTVVPATGSTATARFPVFESVMGSKVVTQECEVTVTDLVGERKYLVAAQYDPDAPVNRALKALSSADWRGSICVLRVGTRVSFTSVTDHWDRQYARRAVSR